MTPGSENEVMSAFSLGCGNLILKLDLMDDVIDKMRQRAEEQLVCPTQKPVCWLSMNVFSDENSDDKNYAIFREE